MNGRLGTSRQLLLLSVFASYLLLLVACAPFSTPPPTSTTVPTLTPIPWPTPPTIRTPLVFSPHELPEAVLGQPYEVTITVTGNRTPVFRVSVEDGELPPGLALHYEERATTATITGVPKEAGEFEFGVGAFCLGTSISGQKGDQRYTLLVRQK